MRLLRFGSPGQERPGLHGPDGIVDLRRHFPALPDIGPAFFSDGWLAKIAHVDDAGQAIGARIGSPVGQPSKIICIGKNYAEHAKEGGFDVPARPLLFNKTPNTLNGPYDPIQLPVCSGQVDWEVELAVVIGQKGKRIAKADVWDYIAGVSVMNDVSGREAQFGDSQWFRGKSFDTFAPLGPELVTLDEIDDINNLTLTAIVNGQTMQTGTTADLIFDIPTLIEYISQDITLEPADIISTGTPEGVGIFRDPPVTLQPGDTVECRIDGIGFLRNTCQGA
jgi:2-keto-4-pentenoate hydratase/2-oxohepta-3-ene-1,7-dioic acid hydratase in catechol pathway